MVFLKRNLHIDSVIVIIEEVLDTYYCILFPRALQDMSMRICMSECACMCMSCWFQLCWISFRCPETLRNNPVRYSSPSEKSPASPCFHGYSICTPSSVSYEMMINVIIVSLAETGLQPVAVNAAILSRGTVRKFLTVDVNLVYVGLYFL